MLKKILIGTGITAVLTAMFLLGSLSIVPAFGQSQSNAALTQAAVQSIDVDDATEAAEQGPDMDSVEEQVGDQNELDADADEAALEDSDLDNVENQVEQDGEFDGEF